MVFPAHPRTRAAIESNSLLLAPHVRLTAPLGYLDFAALASQARVIVTDSGGLQKEAFLLGTPCTTIRPETEWVETLENGWNILDNDLTQLPQVAVRPAPTAERGTPYGDGHTADRVAQVLIEKAR